MSASQSTALQLVSSRYSGLFRQHGSSGTYVRYGEAGLSEPALAGDLGPSGSVAGSVFSVMPRQRGPP
ncbi:MAG: hypothetical protein Q8N23_10610 [Archangium sp.]|nr:hypothetical protein [Archangium sp.]